MTLADAALQISILAGSGANAAYAGESASRPINALESVTDLVIRRAVIAVQSLYYKTDLGMFGGLLLLLSTQLIGFGLSGLTYKLLCVSSLFWRRRTPLTLGIPT